MAQEWLEMAQEIWPLLFSLEAEMALFCYLKLLFERHSLLQKQKRKGVILYWS
ncbi:hypothetical protein Sjap_003351 [Stephania japonica]|uniref:Uncharacterized protein n=1 Tax=Stephania japonica TaxID=461633 RepID=A0AAP0KNK9_9MAGN